MCGWVISRGLATVGLPLIDRIAHRGSREPVSIELPDGWEFSHVRLPIQGDVAQPFTDKKNHNCLVYNGEIFNYDLTFENDTAWLFEQLKKKFYYDYMGRDEIHALERMDGFYSFAFYSKGSVYLGTDYLAKKPVYMRFAGEQLIAASSEMRGVLTDADLENWQRNLDPFWLSTVQKFRYYPFNDYRTWHKDIKTVLPGTLVRIGNHGRPHYRKFGEVIPGYDVVKDGIKREVLPEYLRALLVRSIETRIDLSDVPVSILLSGGLDSSIIYFVAQNLGKEVTTFTIDNAEDQKFVSLLNPKNLEFLNIDDSVELEEILRTNEGPVDLGSMKAQYLIGKAVREKGFDVALSGDGADELFGGYRRINEYDSQQSDVWSELVNYHLPRLDKMMMKHTVELRNPYLARSVVELALALPYELRKNKKILKDAFRDLPKEILERPKEPLKIDSVREDKHKHTHEMVRQWVNLTSPV